MDLFIDVVYVVCPLKRVVPWVVTCEIGNDDDGDHDEGCTDVADYHLYFFSVWNFFGLLDSLRQFPRYLDKEERLSGALSSRTCKCCRAC